ncbi:hypothetical protein [Halobellus rubicundus]|uniref:Uncharacterized protein n=1 Tax=Halobellus rubicundus TaxID=2996466 RepID=A0ABD5MLF8_9EURY
MTDDHPSLRRRTLLAALAGAGTASVAGCSFAQREGDGGTTAADEETARSLAERFAPTLYFDAGERWFPTDPRPYASESDEGVVVDGFDALDGYHERYASAGEPPNRTLFYNAVEYADSPLAVVQFWCYAAFDQFTTNFHWHDWEVLHVFVDTDTGDPQLYVASSHSRKVPNNEFLDPDPAIGPRILSELGSHSSALSVNDEPDQFQRLPGADLLADITNSAIGTVEDVAELPLAYGLPRDEGARLPYLVPEYEGEPVYEHDRLPNVDRESLVPEDLTVRSFESLSSPPTDLPERETGAVLYHGDREAPERDADAYAYDLVPTSELEHITAFTGPQLSFEFDVPEAVEDAVASHITTAGVPWTQSRYENPAADITDPTHRAALAERYDAIGDAAPVNTVVSRVAETISSDDAPDGEGLTTRPTTVEAVALLESDPEAVPTFLGVAVVDDVPAGDHRLTVNGPGFAPYSERVGVGTESGAGTETATTEAGTETETTESGTETATATPADASATTTTEGDDGAGEPSTDPGRRVTAGGVAGEVPLVAREDARKLEVDAEGTDADLTALAVEDDFAGRLYESPLSGSDAVYVHRGGAYTAEVRDTAGAIGAFRVNPDPDPEGDERIRIDEPETGKASLASFLASIATETADELEALFDGEVTLDGAANALRGLVRAFAAVVEAATRAVERAQAGDRAGTNRQLRAVADALERAVERIDDASDAVPETLANAAANRVEQAQRRVEQARRIEKL